MTETTWPAEPKLFTVWPFSERVCWPLVRPRGADLRHALTLNSCVMNSLL